MEEIKKAFATLGETVGSRPKIKIMLRQFAWFVLSSAVVLKISPGFAQGNLVPPGAPAPVMKSLDQLEPRMPVSALPFVITQPGAYYLTTNLYGQASDYGIQILTNNVTLDLNGFALRGHTNSFDGIVIFQSSSNVVVSGGSLTGWGTGFYAVRGLARHSTYQQLTIVGNSFGVSCSDGSVIRDCMIGSNQRDGIDVNGNGSFVLNNTLAGNNSLGGPGNVALGVYGTANRIEGNHITVNNGGFGIYGNISGFTNNIVVRNSVIGAGVNNYSIISGNIVGPFINVTGTITNANPWANFSF